MTESRDEKAQRLGDEGRVLVIFQSDLVTEGRVQKNGGLYHTFVYAKGTFFCNCKWGDVHSYTNDLCVHALAVKLTVANQ